MTQKTVLLALSLICAAAGPAAADFARVTEAEDFRRIIEGKTLTRPLIRLAVLPEGEIRGTGAAKTVSGSWQWQDGFFCRDLSWGDKALGYNCQEVRVNGQKLRFTSDKGTGDSADFNLR